jgi:hypothetical protein
MLMFGVAPAAVADGGFATNFRFGSNGTSAGSTSIHIAAVGVDVIPAATKDTFNGDDRWLVRLFNPYV